MEFSAVTIEIKGINMNEKKLVLHALLIRKKILHIIKLARRGHIGSAFSIVEILVVLYEHFLRINPKKSRLKNRDRFILSKGHGCLALYAVLAQYGFINDKALAGTPNTAKCPVLKHRPDR